MTPTTLILPPEQRNGWWYGRVIRRHHRAASGMVWYGLVWWYGRVIRRHHRAASGHGRVANLHHLTSPQCCTMSALLRKGAHTIALMFVLGCNTEQKVPRITFLFFGLFCGHYVLKEYRKNCHTIFSSICLIFGTGLWDYSHRSHHEKEMI